MIPRPEHFAAMAERLSEDCRELVNDYRWAHSMAFAPGRGEDVKVSRQRPDPTGDVVVSRGEMRKQMEYANKNLRRATALLMAARNHLDNALDDKVVPISGRGGSFLGPKELEATKDAKRRREGRGEGWGDG